MTRAVTLYYAPRTRAFTALALLEEVGVPYDIHLLDLAAGAHKNPDYLAVNPMGKVPAISDGAVNVAETAAIALYLGDRYSLGNLAPALDSPARGDYLRWIVFMPGCIEPAMNEKANKLESNPRRSGWGSYDQVIDVLTKALAKNEYLAGNRYTLADTLIGTALSFMVRFKMMEPDTALGQYAARITARPAFQRAAAIEAKYAPKP